MVFRLQCYMRGYIIGSIYMGAIQWSLNDTRGSWVVFSATLGAIQALGVLFSYLWVVLVLEGPGVVLNGP